MRRDVFQAIADPTRREIINMLAYEPLNVNAITERFDLSRAAIYKHMKMLTECGLLVIEQKGRERYCEAKLEKLSEVNNWIEQYKAVWTHRFDNLDKHLEEMKEKQTKKVKTKRAIK